MDRGTSFARHFPYHTAYDSKYNAEKCKAKDHES
jgi:hypothetical protein